MRCETRMRMKGGMKDESWMEMRCKSSMRIKGGMKDKS